MQSPALFRLAVAAATIASLGAPSAFALNNNSANIGASSSFVANLIKSVTSGNTNNLFTTSVGGPSNQSSTNVSTATAAATSNIIGSSSNTINLSQFGF
jgi:hypothetical protein